MNTKYSMQEKVRQRLLDCLEEAGYSDMTEFWRQSKIQVSHETVRRVLHGGKPASTESFIKIAAHLGMPKHEIVELVEEMGDTFWPRFLRDPKENKKNELWLNLFAAIAKNSEAEKQLLNFVELLSKSHNLNVARLIKALEKANDLQNSSVSTMPKA